MQKTENYNLNKPEATDPLRVEDFNDNADKIDGILAQVMALASAEHIRVGTFTGTGVAGRTVNLGFTPKVIVLLSQSDSSENVSIHVATAQFGCFLNSNGIGTNKSRVVENGVYIANIANNSKEYTNHYIAFV